MIQDLEFNKESDISSPFSNKNSSISESLLQDSSEENEVSMNGSGGGQIILSWLWRIKIVWAFGNFSSHLCFRVRTLTSEERKSLLNFPIIWFVRLSSNFWISIGLVALVHRERLDPGNKKCPRLRPGILKSEQITNKLLY